MAEQNTLKNPNKKTRLPINRPVPPKANPSDTTTGTNVFEAIQPDKAKRIMGNENFNDS